MKSSMGKIFIMAMALSVSAMGSASADENQIAALQEQIAALTKQLNGLQKKLNRVDGNVKKINKKVAKPAPAAAAPTNWISGVDSGGYIDVQWNNNFRQPTGVAGTNSLRIFDNDDGSFNVNSAEIWFEKAAEEVGDAGFRLDIQFGDDVGVVAADGVGGDRVDLQQAYVEYIAPLNFFEGNSILPDSVKIQAGRFVTLAGLEVIEGPDNWNISRSIAFGFSLPFVHTGVRTNFGLMDDYFDAYLGVNNGWDNPTDNNAYKTLEAALGYEPFENVSVFHAWYWGNEKTDGVGTQAGGNRFLWTNVITYDVTDKLTLMGDIDWGREGNAIGQDTANWYEFALYAKYQFTEKFAMAYRLELFNDDSVFRTGLSDRTTGNTLTAEYKLNENLIARGEIRHDKADDDAFQSDHASQTTLGAQLLYII